MTDNVRDYRLVEIDPLDIEVGMEIVRMRTDGGVTGYYHGKVTDINQSMHWPNQKYVWAGPSLIGKFDIIRYSSYDRWYQKVRFTECETPEAERELDMPEVGEFYD